MIQLILYISILIMLFVSIWVAYHLIKSIAELVNDDYGKTN